MMRFTWAAALLTVLTAVMSVAAAAGPTDPPYPSRINFPAPSVDPTTGAVTTNFSPEGMEIYGNTFWAGSTQTGEILKGNLETGTYDRNWVAASPAQPSDLHRGVLGLLRDDHNRLWAASSYGMACGGGGTQPACPAGVTGPFTNYGVAVVYDATTGAQLAQYTLSTAATKTINDMTIANNAVWFSNTSAPNGAGTEVQFKLQLGPHGALPPGDVPPAAPARGSVNPAVTAIPTPGFTGADGIDTLPNGNIILNSFNGTSSGQMIVIDTKTLAVTPVTVTAGATCLSGQCAPPLLSGDGVALDGDLLYTPENRLDTLTPPGDWAVVHLDPPDFTHAEIVARLNSPPGSGLPPLRSPANMGQLGPLVYGISRVVSANPVTGALNVTQTFIEHLDKVPPTECSNAGEVHADAHFLMPGSKKDVHFDLEGACKANGNDVVLEHAHAKVEQGGQKLIDAKSDNKHDEITAVKIIGSSAVIAGTDSGNSFFIVLTDGDKYADDTASVLVTDSAGHVVFDSSTLSAKHDPHVDIHEK